jgi:hypothetical protein
MHTEQITPGRDSGPAAPLPTETDALNALAVALEHTEGADLDAMRAWVARTRKSATSPLKGEALDQTCRTAYQRAAATLRDRSKGTSMDDAFQSVQRALAQPRSGLLAQRTTLGTLLSGGIPDAEFLESPSLGERLFYREALFIVSGHKKSGKSWAMAATALDCAHAGRPAVYIDLENGERLFGKRMLLLGADPATVDEYLHYIQFPKGLTLENLRDELEALADALPGAFVVMDSLRGLMTRLSPPGNPLNPNDHQAIEAVCGPMMEAAKTSGLSIGIIDHAKKTGNDKDEYSTAGAGAKEAAVDAVYFWTKDEPYNKETAGIVKIAATSDRQGELDFERFYRVGGQGDGPFRLTRVSPDEVGTMGKLRSAVFDFLADHEGEQFTANKLTEKVTGNGAQIRRAAELVAAVEPRVHRDPNSRRKGSWVYSYDSGREEAAGDLAL